MLKAKSACATILAAIALLASAPGAMADDYPINPGYWQVTTQWLGLITKTDLYCIEPRNIARFLGGPCNHIYHCDYPVQQIEDGKVYFEGMITGHNEAYKVHGGGSYSPTTMDVSFVGSGHWRMVPIVGASASIKARYLDSACPVEAKRLK